MQGGSRVGCLPSSLQASSLQVLGQELSCPRGLGLRDRSWTSGSLNPSFTQCRGKPGGSAQLFPLGLAPSYSAGIKRRVKEPILTSAFFPKPMITHPS